MTSAPFRWAYAIASRVNRIGVLFLVALLPALIGGTVLVLQTYQHARDELERSALQLARALSQVADGELVRIERQLRILASSPALQTGDLKSFYEQAQNLQKIDSFGGAIVLLDAEGRQAINTLQPFGAALAATAHPELTRKTFESGIGSISDLYFGAVRKQLIVSVEVPVFRDQRVSYALDMNFQPASLLNATLERQKLPEDWIAAILDSRATVIARSLNPQQFIGQPATPDLQQQMKLAAEGHFASATLEGKPSFLAFSRSSYSGWTVVVGVSRQVLYRGLYGPVVVAAITMLAFIAAGVIMTHAFSAYVRESLQNLYLVTAAASRGNLDVTVPLRGPDEVVKLAILFNQMNTARKKAEEESIRLAYFDPLTKLPNRRLLKDRAAQAFAHAARNQLMAAVCFIDLDGFKEVNDRWGHDAGDEALTEIARRFLHFTRAEDTLARLGGDEFVLLIGDLKSRDECFDILKRVVAVAAQPIQLSQDREISLSSSIGVAFFPSDGTDGDTLLRLADQAMYRAKQGGKNQFRTA